MQEFARLLVRHRATLAGDLAGAGALVMLLVGGLYLPLLF